jgi:hypothetical protein
VGHGSPTDDPGVRRPDRRSDRPWFAGERPGDRAHRHRLRRRDGCEPSLPHRRQPTARTGRVRHEGRVARGDPGGGSAAVDRNAVRSGHLHPQPGRGDRFPFVEARRDGARARRGCRVRPRGARENGAVVTARKGVTNVHLRFEGRAAHAGVEPEKGRSAILEAAHKTIASRRSTGNGTARRSTSARATAVAGSTSFPITRRSPSRSAR